MKMNKKQILAGIIVSVVTLPLLVTNSFADKHMSMDDETHEKMMKERGMGMMGGGMGRGGGMGMMNMMGGGMMGQGGGMGMMGGGMMGGDMSSMMMQMLDLDDKQKEKIRGIAREQRKERCANMTAMMDIRDELAAAYDKDEPDAKAIGKIYSKLADKKRQMLEQSIETRNKMRAVLNKEQKEQFDNMHRRGGGMGMMGGGMMGQGSGMGMMNMMGGGMGMME